MNLTTEVSQFQHLIESVESLSIIDQEMLLDILNKRLREQKRINLIDEINLVRKQYQEGNVKSGSVDDFLLELDGISKI